MNSVFFSRLSGVKRPIGDLAGLYADWALGKAGYERRRPTRIAQGVGPTWTRAALLRGGTFSGSFDCSIVARKSDTI